MRYTMPTFGDCKLFRGLLLFAMLLTALPTFAHPLPLSYVDLRLNSTGLEVCMEAPAVDLAQELPSLAEKALLDSGMLKAHRQGRRAIYIIRARRFRLLQPTIRHF